MPRGDNQTNQGCRGKAKWATQGCTPLLRTAITFSARRALTAGIRRSTCSGAEAAYDERWDDVSLPPTRRAASTARLTRLLLGSDLLRVAAYSGSPVLT